MKTLLLLLLAVASLPAAAAPPDDALDKLVLAAGVPAPTFALAQAEPVPAPVVAPAPTVGAKLLELVTTPSGLGTIVMLVFGALGGLLGTNEVRRRRVALGVYHAFHIVEDLSKETETTVDDKIAAGLKAADEYLVANGWRPLKPGEVAVAKLGFSALNGASKLAEKVQANAIEAASPVPPKA